MTLNEQQVRQLEVLCVCPHHKRKHLLKIVPNSCIKAISECCHNLLCGNIKISKGQKKTLTPYKTVLRTLAQKRVPLSKKRDLLVQKGNGILSILIPAAITAISSLLSR